MIAYLVDAFTQNRFEGNRAGVVFDADSLSTDQKQAIAAEINASETAFVSASTVADYKVEFFTPQCPIDFCGHATLATFHMLAKTDEKLGARLQDAPVELTQETKAGVMTIVLSLEDGEPKITMHQRAPQFAAPNADTSAIADALNIKVEELDGRFVPALANTGNWHLIVAVKSRATLDSIKYDTNALSAILAEAKAATAHVFYADATTYFARNFCPTIGIAEDPATGAAAGAFIAYLVKNNYLECTTAQQGLTIEILQGQAMGRPSKIRASATIKDGQIDDVTVSGRATLSFTLRN